MAQDHKPKPEAIDIKDEPGWAERFQRGLQRALNTPPKHRTKTTAKTKERPASTRKRHGA